MSPQMWRKSEISFIISDLRCFVAKSFCRDLRAIVWRKFEPKIVPVEKSDKYEVCQDDDQVEEVDDDVADDHDHDGEMMMVMHRHTTQNMMISPPVKMRIWSNYLTILLHIFFFILFWSKTVVQIPFGPKSPLSAVSKLIRSSCRSH